MHSDELPTPAEVVDASRRIAPFVLRTPVVRSRILDEWLGVSAWLKCEHLQHAGAFKYRGATNAVQLLEARTAARGVCAHSSGNHAAALALAARVRGIAAYVVVPADASPAKRAAVTAFGASITECAPTLEARERALDEVRAATGAHEIHPYDDRGVIAGAGTAALELLEVQPELDVLVVPVGGGGLLSGTCLAARRHDRPVRVIGAQPAGADDAARSLAAKALIRQADPRTIADGLRTSLSERTFAVISAHVESIATVSERDIVTAMRVVWQRTGHLIEPSAAVAIAAVRLLAFAPRTQVGIVVSGGNVDVGALPW
jgi:threonine dehydratase